MVEESVRAAIAELIDAAREAVAYLAQDGDGSAGERLSENLARGLGSLVPLMESLEERRAVPAFHDTLMAVVAVARRTALPSMDGENRAELEGALKAADELLADWAGPVSIPKDPKSAEILPFRPRV